MSDAFNVTNEIMQNLFLDSSVMVTHVKETKNHTVIRKPKELSKAIENHNFHKEFL